MNFKLSFAPNTIKTNSVFRVKAGGDQGSQTFPGLYIDRYSYIVNAAVHSMAQAVPKSVYALHIGAFNSIAWDVDFIIDHDHDYKSVSMAECELFKAYACRDSFRHKRKGSVIIQNDVWIGHGCTIYSGVTVHNGAVVAGNAVVTKDVPPYCIVGGNPARVIKPRFDGETIEKLLAVQWWDWSDEKIRENRAWFAKEPAAFAHHFYKRLPPQENACAVHIPPFEKTYLFFPDFDEPYGIWPHVIQSFCRAFSARKGYGLVLFVDKSQDTERCIQNIKELTRDIDAACSLYMYAGDTEEEAPVFSRADYYITSRSPRTVKRTCLADRFHVPILSGVDVPVF